jgi:multidrug/hemolysin transport system permease protein
VRELMDNWIMAGLLAVTSVTTTMGAFGIMVHDRTKKISKDFLSSPISRRSLAGGYVLSAFIIGFIMSLVTLVLAELYIVSSGGALMSLETFLKVIGVILLADLSATSIVFFLTSFFSSETAFGTASTVIGTLIGFLTGIYLPVGTLPEAVQWVVKLFPPSHAAALMRQVMMEKPLSASFEGVPAEYLEEIEKLLGVTFKFGSVEFSALAHIAVLLLAAAVFFVLAVINMSRKKR